jgi:hypothetical protein
MMKIKLLSLLIVIAGCSQVLQRLELESEIPRSAIQTSSELTACARPSLRSPQLVGSNPKAQRGFTDFLKEMDDLKLDFIEKTVLWSLLQINIRPDLASPTARFQFMVRQNEQSLYRDFSMSEKGGYPFFAGLNDLLKNHPKKRGLLWYAKLLDDKFKTEIVAGKTLELRLREMKAVLGPEPILRRHFFRGDELIRESERLSKVNFQKLVKATQEKNIPTPMNETLFSYRRTPQLDVRCNYDFTLYDNSIFLIDKDENVGHLFGLTQGKDAFLAVVAQKTNEPKALFGEAVIEGTAKVRSSAFCLIKSQSEEIWVTSNQSRDPGQHVYHLFRYGLTKAHTPEDIQRLLRHSRHMFLSDPLRLVIESSRSRGNQIQELLKLNVPIYNAESMGNIWAWSDLANEGGRFFIDDRNPGALFCAP